MLYNQSFVVYHFANILEVSSTNKIFLFNFLKRSIHQILPTEFPNFPKGGMMEKTTKREFD